MKNTPPLRLRDDPEAPSLLRGDLARAQVSLPSFDAERALASFQAAIGNQAITQGATPKSPVPAPAVLGAAAKGIVGGIGGILLVGAAVLSASSSRPPNAVTSHPLTTSTARESAERTPASVKMTDSAIVEAPVSAAPAVLMPTVAVSASSVPVVSHPATRPLAAPSSSAPTVAIEPVAPPAVVTAPTRSPLELEMELIARLRALEPADPAQALALADEGQRRFAGGFFAQEREALAIASLTRLGRRGEAASRARAFMAAYPKSHFVERIRPLTESAN